MVKTLHRLSDPLGVVLVALLGVGVAEHTGFINDVPDTRHAELHAENGC